jgi:hypothetical protein
MRFFTYTWPFTFGVGLGWATAGVAQPDPRTARGRVYLLRGQGIIFSSGFGALCRTLRLRGVWAEDLRCVGDRWVLADLHRDLQMGTLNGPVIFVGHSCGGRYALFAAEQLRALGVTVDLLIGIDVAGPAPVPANVRRAVNIYRGGWRIYPAGRLCPAVGSTGEVENIDIADPESALPLPGVHHLNITEQPETQALVLRHILAVVDSRSERHSPALPSSSASATA